jgi:hypothetical protein
MCDVTGTRPIYEFIREKLGVRFNRGLTELDTDLEKIYAAIVDNRLTHVTLSASCWDAASTDKSQ